MKTKTLKQIEIGKFKVILRQDVENSSNIEILFTAPDLRLSSAISDLYEYDTLEKAEEDFTLIQQILTQMMRYHNII